MSRRKRLLCADSLVAGVAVIPENSELKLAAPRPTVVEPILPPRVFGEDLPFRYPALQMRAKPSSVRLEV